MGEILANSIKTGGGSGSQVKSVTFDVAASPTETFVSLPDLVAKQYINPTINNNKHGYEILKPFTLLCCGFPMDNFSRAPSNINIRYGSIVFQEPECFKVLQTQICEVGYFVSVKIFNTTGANCQARVLYQVIDR